MNVLIIGNNPKHAKIFSVFSNNVYIMLQKDVSGINRLSKELNDYEIIFSELEYGTCSYRINRAKEIRNIIRKYDVDLIFSNRRDDMIHAKISTLGMKTKPLLLVTFHNSTAWVNNLKVKIMAKLLNVCTDGCVCLASFMYNNLVKYGMSKHKLIFLPNTIQYENFIVKTDYQIKEKDKVKICYTAVISPLKNQKIIIEAINVLKEKYNFEVHLFGDFVDECYYEELKTLINNYQLVDIIYLDGRLENNVVREILPRNDIYISSTTIEMSPYNILEAKASGLPILASNVLGQKDLIENNVDGILYELDDINDLIEKLDLLITRPELRKKLGEKARFSVAEEKSYKIAAQKLNEFVKELKQG